MPFAAPGKQIRILCYGGDDLAVGVFGGAPFLHDDALVDIGGTAVGTVKRDDRFEIRVHYLERQVPLRV